MTWIKQLTRENSLLDRSLRMLAYYQAIPEVGKARWTKSLVVGRGAVTSQYYSPQDYKKQQATIIKEFCGSRVVKMGKAIAQLLKGKTTNFYRLHRYARGAILYGYWGEPVVTSQLKKSMSDSEISLLSTPKDVKGLHKNSPKLEQARTKLISTLPPKQKELGEILSWFTLFYEVGEKVASAAYERFLKALKTKTADPDIEWYNPESLTNYFKGKKLPADEIARRKQFYILELKNGKIKVLSGQKAREFYHKNLVEKLPAQTSQIKGTVASPGYAKGVVKIVITQADQNKMEPGDILVSTMTTPRLMLAVKKAAAIVTDEGGLTAHAAIVSRELGIPCIIGTKIATQVFKDGDQIEVDATNGIIRKI